MTKYEESKTSERGHDLPARGHDLRVRDHDLMAGYNDHCGEGYHQTRGQGVTFPNAILGVKDTGAAPVTSPTTSGMGFRQGSGHGKGSTPTLPHLTPIGPLVQRGKTPQCDGEVTEGVCVCRGRGCDSHVCKVQYTLVHTHIYTVHVNYTQTGISYRNVPTLPN